MPEVPDLFDHIPNNQQFKSRFDELSEDEKESIRKRGDLLNARMTPGPRDLDGRIGEIVK